MFTDNTGPYWCLLERLFYDPWRDEEIPKRVAEWHTLFEPSDTPHSARCLAELAKYEQRTDEITPGTYRITVSVDFTGLDVCTYEFPLPLPDVVHTLDDEQWNRLAEILRNEDDGRTPDDPLRLITEHLDEFQRQHARDETP